MRETTSQDAVKLIEDKIVRGGMIPKVRCVLAYVPLSSPYKGPDVMCTVRPCTRRRSATLMYMYTYMCVCVCVCVCVSCRLAHYTHQVNCCVTALANGVKAAHIIDGREPHSLLMEILTDVGCGTKIDA